MQAQIIPFPVAATRGHNHTRQVSTDGEFFEDDVPPVLFDADEDGEELAQELGMYVHMADHWND